VLQGVYANLSQDPNKYVINGFVPSGDIAPAKRGFSIAESELGFSANVDDKNYANLILSLSPDNSVEVEEAYGVLTALPGGLRPKFGRFLSSIGYLNDQHQHDWDFYNAPLPYQAFLGSQFRSDGLQLKWGRRPTPTSNWVPRSAMAQAFRALSAIATASAILLSTRTLAVISGPTTVGAPACLTLA